MDSNKYLMALIKLPILVKSTGEMEPLNDHIQLEITPCEDIPPKNDNSAIDEYYKKQMSDAFSAYFPKPIRDYEQTVEPNTNDQEQEQDQLFVHISEIIKTRQPSLNISFKNKKLPRRFTAKSRHYNI